MKFWNRKTMLYRPLKKRTFESNEHSLCVRTACIPAKKNMTVITGITQM